MASWLLNCFSSPQVASFPTQPPIEAIDQNAFPFPLLSPRALSGFVFPSLPPSHPSAAPVVDNMPDESFRCHLGMEEEWDSMMEKYKLRDWRRSPRTREDSAGAGVESQEHEAAATLEDMQRPPHTNAELATMAIMSSTLETASTFRTSDNRRMSSARGNTISEHRSNRCEVCNCNYSTKSNLKIHTQSYKHVNNVYMQLNQGARIPDELFATFRDLLNYE